MNHTDPATKRESETRGSLSLAPPPEQAPNAGPRALARASTALETNTDANTAAAPSSPTRRDLARAVRRWATPPNPKTTAPPTWHQLAWHGDHGQHVPAEGWPRSVSVMWSRTIAQPLRALAIWLDWVARSPSRCLVAVVFYVLVVHLPGMGWLPWFY